MRSHAMRAPLGARRRRRRLSISARAGPQRSRARRCRYTDQAPTPPVAAAPARSARPASRRRWAAETLPEMAEVAPDPRAFPADCDVNHPTAARLRAAFDAAPAYTVGIEDEVMLLDPDTLGLVPLASDVLERLGGDERFKLELPASQLEIVTPASRDLGDVEAVLLDARRTLAARAEPLALL